MSTVDDVYARMDDLVPPTAIEIEDAFLGAVFERDRLAARLAEVEDEAARLAEGWTEANESEKELEAERDEARRRLAEVEAANAKFIEKLNTHLTAEDRRSLAALLGYELGVEEGRAEGRAERERLAQELEDAVEAMRKAARGPSPASAVTGFLARFPVKEGDA